MADVEFRERAYDIAMLTTAVKTRVPTTECGTSHRVGYNALEPETESESELEALDSLGGVGLINEDYPVVALVKTVPWAGKVSETRPDHEPVDDTVSNGRVGITRRPSPLYGIGGSKGTNAHHGGKQVQGFVKKREQPFWVRLSEGHPFHGCDDISRHGHVEPREVRLNHGASPEGRQLARPFGWC